jgi:hypothetical protein
MTGYDSAFFPPESHLSMLAPARHSLLSSEGGSGATAMREDSEKAALRKGKEKAVPYPSSAIHEDVMVTMDVVSWSPSPQSIVDVTGAFFHPALLMQSTRMASTILCNASNNVFFFGPQIHHNYCISIF